MKRFLVILALAAVLVLMVSVLIACDNYDPKVYEVQNKELYTHAYVVVGDVHQTYTLQTFYFSTNNTIVLITNDGKRIVTSVENCMLYCGDARGW